MFLRELDNTLSLRYLLPADVTRRSDVLRSIKAVNQDACLYCIYSSDDDTTDLIVSPDIHMFCCTDRP